jgi:hypothetical protein
MVLFSIILQGQDVDNGDFEIINQSREWYLKFNDDCTENWQSKWFLDGLRAEVKNTKEGMVFSAGAVEGDDACHAVLWTKDSFKGDVKIEYNYTRTDTRTSWVNILYIQAIGVDPFSNDISEWNDLRIIPSMNTYFMNMKALHISYAAYNRNNSDEKNDYVRARRYPVLPGQDFSTTTEIPTASFKTGLFNPGETYRITVIKTDEKLYFKVDGKNDSKLFSWNLTSSHPVLEGRIGLRHMYTRSARYKNFIIYIKK